MAYYILRSYRLKTSPVEIFQALSTEKHCFFLDSSLSSSSLGRYSFIGADPFYCLESKGGESLIVLRRMLERYQMSIPGCAIPFLGGAVGYLAYDGEMPHPCKEGVLKKGQSAIPQTYFGFFNTIIAIDTIEKRLFIIAVGFPEKKYHLAKALCNANFKKMRRLLATIDSCVSRSSLLLSRRNAAPADKAGIESSFKKDEYVRAIKKAKSYIRKGDIYQVNLSQRFHAVTALSPVQLYRRLRGFSPCAFGGYFDAEDFQILSASPERFLRLKGNQVSTRPMKGTRARGAQRRQDQRLKKELLRSPKDKAELLMIVDLERNDLGRVCEYGTVAVSAMRQLEQYSTVFQTTATVQGKLHRSKDRIDLLRACFPGGSVTGCPKIRAMEIIEELEPVRRAVYTGCLGYLSFSGTMDFNILIRTIMQKDRDLYFSVGGGIVADSVPETEYEETLVKARALMQAIGLKD